jgi:hypothetical protein
VSTIAKTVSDFTDIAAAWHGKMAEQKFGIEMHSYCVSSESKSPIEQLFEMMGLIFCGEDSRPYNPADPLAMEG